MPLAVSELHSRLEHLVTYSSQLIFVSGNSLGQQQQALEAFLSHQTDKTELAFLNGEPGHSVQSYRKQIQKQLLGDELGLFNRPLNELLAPLNHHDGPVLICICQAEHLPQSFLQELWELVLQSRFAENKQHLNVLLFGQPQWAEQAKAWLPDNNRDRPLLLSTESVQAQSEQYAPPSELDQLIARKREAFAKRLEARNYAPPEPVAPLARRGFRVFILSVFLVLFSALLSWQYQDELLAWLQTSVSEPLPQTSETKTASGGTPSKENADSAEQVGEAAAAPLSEIANADVAIPAEAEQANSLALSASDQARITDWSTAVASMRLPDETISTPETESPSGTPEQPASLASQAQTAFGEQNTETLTSDAAVEEDRAAELTELVALENINPVEDYQVEDIVSVEQLPVPTLTENNLAPQETETDPAKTAVLNSSELQFHEDTLATLPANQFVIQIAGLADPGVLLDYVADNRLQGDTWLYRTQRYGGVWYVLLVNQTYPSLQAARQGIEQLPGNMLRGVPFAKTVEQAQQEIRLLTDQ